MATLTIKIDNSFTLPLKEFSGTMKKFEAFTKQVQRSQRLTIPTHYKQQTATFADSWRRMQRSIRRFEEILNRSVDRFFQTMGGTARYIVRGLEIDSVFIMPRTLAFLGPIGFGLTIAIAATTGIFRWFWQKTVAVSEAMVKDRMAAVAGGTTVGGVRALRVAFGDIQNIETFAQLVMMLQYNQTSRTASTIRALLGVKFQQDSMDTVMQTMLALQRYMQKQPKELSLRTMQMQDLNIDEEVLLQLYSMKPSDLQKKTAEYLKLRPKYETPTEVQRLLVGFIVSVRDMWVSIETSLGKKLASLGIVDSLIKISQAMPGLMDTLLHLPITQDALKSAERGLRWIGEYLQKTDNIKTMAMVINKMIEDLERGLMNLADLTGNTKLKEELGRKKMRRDIGYYDAPGPDVEWGTRATKPTFMWGMPEGGIAFRPKAGYGAYMTKRGTEGPTGVTGPTFRRGIGPGTRSTPSEGPTRDVIPFKPRVQNVPRNVYIPGTQGLQPKGGIRRTRNPRDMETARKQAEQYDREHPPQRVPGGRRGQPAEPPPPRFKAPTTLEQAEKAQTVAGAKEQGFVRGGGEIDRSRFAKELQENPELREKILQIAANEQSTNPNGTQSVMESMMNRAEVNHTSLERQARWTSEGGYYDDRKDNHRRAISTVANPANREVLERSLDNTLKGGNVSNYATDNASGDLARRRRENNEMNYASDYNGETFFSPGRVSGAGVEKNYREWRQSLEAQPKGGLQSYTAEDINRSIRGLPPVSPQTRPSVQPQVKGVRPSFQGGAPGIQGLPGTPSGPARAAPSAPVAPGALGATPGQKDRPYYYGGTVEIDGETYHFGTGGGGRGSLPYGTFVLDPGGVGPEGRTKLQAIAGINDTGKGNEVADPKIGTRYGVEIHPSSSPDLDRLYTAGCFAVPRKEWPAFRDKFLQMAKTSKDGKLYLTVTPTEKGKALARITANRETPDASEQKAPPSASGDQSFEEWREEQIKKDPETYRLYKQYGQEATKTDRQPPQAPSVSPEQQAQLERNRTVPSAAGVQPLVGAPTARQDPNLARVAQPGTQVAPPVSGSKGTMLFLHGMQTRYHQGGVSKTSEQIEADARRYAEAKGYKFEPIRVSGDDPAKQEAAARARIAQGGGDVKAVTGFSAGGYTAARIRKDYPDLDYTITGAPNAQGNRDIGKKHMNLMGNLADEAEQQRTQDQRTSTGTDPTGQGSVTMMNQRAGRSEPLNQRLNDQLNTVSAKTGVGFEVFSGGENADPRRGFHSGSGRHMHGGAADTTMFVMENGQKRYLNASDPRDRAKIQEVIAESRRQGITGIGVGPGYMEGHEGTAIHLGGGRSALWGAGNSGANAPQYARDAYEDPSQFPSHAPDPPSDSTAKDSSHPSDPKDTKSKPPAGEKDTVKRDSGRPQDNETARDPNKAKVADKEENTGKISASNNDHTSSKEETHSSMPDGAKVENHSDKSVKIEKKEEATTE